MSYKALPQSDRSTDRSAHQVFVAARDHQTVGGEFHQRRAAVEVVLEGHPAGEAVPLQVGAESDQVLTVGAPVTAAHQLPETRRMALAEREQDPSKSRRINAPQG